MIANASRLFAALAALGWTTAIVLSIASLAGFDPPAWIRNTLFAVVLPVMIASIVLLNWANAARALSPRFLWAEAREHSPAWLLYGTYGSLLFAFGLFGIQFFDFVVPVESSSLAVLSFLFASALVGLLAALRSVASSQSNSAL